MLVGHGEGDFCIVVLSTLFVVAGDTDHLSVVKRDERHAVVIVDGGEILDLFGVQ
jgi:hypothetical protein